MDVKKLFSLICDDVAKAGTCVCMRLINRAASTHGEHHVHLSKHWSRQC